MRCFTDSFIYVVGCSAVLSSSLKSHFRITNPVPNLKTVSISLLLGLIPIVVFLNPLWNLIKFEYSFVLKYVQDWFGLGLAVLFMDFGASKWFSWDNRNNNEYSSLEEELISPLEIKHE